MYKKLYLILIVFFCSCLVGCGNLYVNYTKSAEIIEISKNDSSYELKLVVKEKSGEDVKIEKAIVSVEGEDIRSCFEKLHSTEYENIVFSSAQYIILNGISSKSQIRSICTDLSKMKEISPKSYVYLTITDVINDNTRDVLQSKLKNIQNVNFAQGNELYIVSSNSVKNDGIVAIPIITTEKENIYSKYVGVCEEYTRFIPLDDFKLICDRCYKFKPFTIILDDSLIDVKRMNISSNIIEERGSKKLRVNVSPFCFIRENIENDEMRKVKSELEDYIKKKFFYYIDEENTELSLYNMLNFWNTDRKFLDEKDSIDYQINVNTDLIFS